MKESHNGQDLKFYLDSLLVASQLNGVYKVKNAQLRELLFQIRELESQFNQIIYKHVPRAQNRQADKLVNIALDEQALRIKN